MRSVVYTCGGVCGIFCKAMECGTIYEASRLHNPDNAKSKLQIRDYINMYPLRICTVLQSEGEATK